MRASEGKVRARQGGLLGQFPSSEKSVTQTGAGSQKFPREGNAACVQRVRGPLETRDRFWNPGCLYAGALPPNPSNAPPPLLLVPLPPTTALQDVDALSPLCPPLCPNPDRSHQGRTRLTGSLFWPLKPLLLARGGKKVPSKTMSGPRHQTRVADLDRGPRNQTSGQVPACPNLPVHPPLPSLLRAPEGKGMWETSQQLLSSFQV